HGSCGAGAWSGSEGFSCWQQDLVELDGRRLGIVGFGAIGRRVASIAAALGMHMLVHTRTRRPATGIEYAELDELFRRADVVTLHCPLTESTFQLVNAERLASMKRSAYLIKIGR